MLIFTSGTSGEPKAVRCTHDKVAFPGVMIAERFGLGAGRHLLPVDADVPLQRCAGRLGARGRGRRVDCVAPQVLRIRSSFPMSGGSTPPTPTMSASRCPTSWPPPSSPMTSRTRCASCTATRARPVTSTGSPAIRRDGCRRLRILRGRGVHCAHARTPRRARSVRSPTTRHHRCRHRPSCPPGVVGELVNATVPDSSGATTTIPMPKRSGWPAGSITAVISPTAMRRATSYFAGRLGDWMRVDGENLGNRADRTGADALSRGD